MGLSEEEIRELLARARAARENARAPYSGFRVGAAVQTDQGEVVIGVNVENASYGLTICAERVAIAAAVARGARSFRGLAVVAGTEVPVSPCGACRQVMREFGTDWPIILGNLGDTWIRTTPGELLPRSFGPGDLAGGRDASGLETR